LEPHLIWVIKAQEKLYRKKKHYKSAALEARKLVKLKGFEAGGFIRLGEIEELKGNTRRARKYYLQAMVYQDSAYLHLKVGKLYIKGNPKKAITYLKKGTKLTRNARLKRDLYYNLGKAFCKTKNRKKMSTSYNRAYSWDRNFTIALKKKGQCEMILGANKSASRSFERFLKKNSEDATVWRLYGIALSNSKKYRAAQGALYQALQLKPTDSAHYHLARVLLSLNRPKDAKRHAQKAYELNPKNSKAKALLAKIVN